jgi:hypothetical protein
MGGDCESDPGLPAKAKPATSGKNNNLTDLHRHFMQHPKKACSPSIIAPFDPPEIPAIPQGLMLL